MRIWLAPSAFAPHRGGVEELTLKLAQHLRAAGDDVLVVTNQHPGTLPATDTVEGVPVRRIPFTTPGRRPRRVLHHLANLRRTQAALDALGPAPDVVHVVCPSSQLPPLSTWCRHTGVPLVVTSQGETEMDAGRLYQRSAWMRRHLRAAAPAAAALTSCSAWTAEAAGRLAPRFRGSTVIPNGVDPADWADVADRPAEPVVVAWGRHVPQKGFDLLLDAWPLVRQSVPDARLVLGGDGPETPRLRARSGPGVTLAGSLDRAGVRDLLASARVAVVPSRIEPFGIVAVEALAAGRGLVYSAGTGLAEAAGTCGRAAVVTDRQALAAAVVAELRDPTPADDARAHAAHLSWANLSERYRAVHAEAVGPVGRPATGSTNVIVADLRHMTATWDASPARVLATAAAKAPFYPAVAAMMWVRTSMWLWRHGLRLPAQWCKARAVRVAGVEVHPGAQVGPGFAFVHSAGIVVGKDVVAGRDLVLYHGTTLGHGGVADGQPRLGDRVRVGAGAKVLGAVTVGDGVTIGANAVVLADVPAGTTVVGVWK